MTRRLAALASLLLLLGSIVLAVVIGIEGFPRGLAVLACVVAALLAVWWGAVREGVARVAGLVTGALLLAGAIVIVIVEGRPLANLVVLGAFALSVAAARFAFAIHVTLPDAPRPERAVLFYNPKSGGGKAIRFHLADEARARGIEPIELSRGDDLVELVRGAIARGADALSMAGGDGSQAVVAAEAAEHGLPYACIPSGTRNHFALDLGVDRNDVVGALEALVNGRERRVDLAEVNGRVFVNNVSLGFYAEAVQEEGYREAKLRTLAGKAPQALGSADQAPALHWTGPDGSELASAAALLVSNDPYRLGRALGSGTRPRLDRGLLGMAAFGSAGGNGLSRLGLKQWSSETFEVRSDHPVAAGIDGEAAVLEPPLRFRTRPAVLRVRIAPHHPGASPSAAMPERPWDLVPALVLVAFGPAP
jgi:diacylglycerol kinase family enzyme